MKNIIEILENFLNILKKISQNFEVYWGEFWKIFWKILRIRYIKKSGISFQTISEIFQILSKIILENFENYYPQTFWIIFRKICRFSIQKIFENCQNILENFEKYFGKFQGILPKFLRIVWKIYKKKFQKISRFVEKNLENYFIKLKKLLRKILRIISQNLDYHIKKFRISENFEKYFLQKLLSNI